VLNSRAILTAAHCVEDSARSNVILGAHNIYLNEANQQRLTADQYRFHPAYNRQSFANNLAILMLNNDVLLNDWSSPVRPKHHHHQRGLSRYLFERH
jgi:secreted trypsin-like serine protease